MKPLVIGLTGPIGSGKSHVRSVLVSLGAEGIDADRVAHEVMAPDGPAYPAIVAEFGPAILGRRVSSIAGGSAAGLRDPAALARLEAIVHPAVARRSGSGRGFDRTLSHRGDQAPGSRAGAFAVRPDLGCGEHPPTQFARLKASRGMSTDEVRIRLANQMPPGR